MVRDLVVIENEDPKSRLILVEGILDISNSGVIIDDEVVYSYDRASRILGDNKSQVIFNHAVKLEVVEVKTQQVHANMVNVIRHPNAPYYPLGHLTHIEPKNGAFLIKMKMIDIPSNETINVIPLLRENMIQVMPIIKNGILRSIAFASRTQLELDIADELY